MNAGANQVILPDAGIPPQSDVERYWPGASEFYRWAKE
jgi:hypothetical protein